MFLLLLFLAVPIGMETKLNPISLLFFFFSVGVLLNDAAIIVVVVSPARPSVRLTASNSQPEHEHDRL